MSQSSTTSKWKRGAAAAAGVALAATLLATQGGPSGINASSHREAPLIAGDPRADNTDVYAFVSPDAPDTVSLIANWIPFEEPNGGPNFYPWAEDTLYNINVDNDGDAIADLIYTWVFTNVVKPGADDNFLVNVGPFSSVNDATLLRYQTYELIVTDTKDTVASGDDVVLASYPNIIAAPSAAGATSTPNYQKLVDEAVASGTVGGLKSFAGQADDPFFLDLRVFDLLYGANATEVGEDTLAGYNVNTIALQVPKNAIALAGDAAANPVVGIWSTTDRRTTRAANGAGTGAVEYTQVSRLGNPLVNEVVIPLSLKDAFNSIDPTQDLAALDAVTKPILPPIVKAVYGVPVPGDNNGDGDNSDAGDDLRTDLVEIFLQGVSVANGGTGSPDQHPALKADLNSLALNAGVSSITPSEMLRLNMAVPVTPDAKVSNLGVLGGDFQGFPNGRRLADDVVDIALRVVEGAVFKSGADVSGLATLDSVDRNDRKFSKVFPYVALPHLDSVTNGTEQTPRAPEVISVVPERILETRSATPYTQIGYTGAKPTAGQTVKVKVAGVGQANVPSDAKAVYLNVTSTESATQGVVTVYPCNQTAPKASNLNPEPTRSASAVVPAVMDADGNVCLFTTQSTHLIVDVNAYHPSSAAFVPIVPQRVLETRVSEGQIGFTGTKPANGTETRIQVTGIGAAALPIGTKSVIVNITTTNTEADGWVVAYRCGATRPDPASNVNTVAGAIRSNPASVEVAANGSICLYNKGATDLVVDLMGAAPASSSFVPTTPKRILETRPADGRINYTAAKPVADQVIELKVAGGNTGVPADAGTVVLNVTGTQNEAASFITVFPCGITVPNASNINVETTTVAGLVVADVGDGGRVCLYNKASQHVIVDLMGYYPGTILAN